MEKAVKELFERYERAFERGLAGEVDRKQIAALYADEFIAAWLGGVRAGKNNASLAKALAKDYANNRKIGTKSMRARSIVTTPIDDAHCVAKVGWTATYARDDLPKTVIDFDVTYLVQVLDGEAKVFGWVTGDEQALLKERGVI